MKVIFAASSGGHYAQLLQLRPAMEKCESVIITEKTDSIRKEKNMYLVNYSVTCSRVVHRMDGQKSNQRMFSFCKNTGFTFLS